MVVFVVSTKAKLLNGLLVFWRKFYHGLIFVYSRLKMRYVFRLKEADKLAAFLARVAVWFVVWVRVAMMQKQR